MPTTQESKVVPTKEDIIKRLDSINQKLNAIGGRILVPAMGQVALPGSMKEAHDLFLKAGEEVDDLINDLL